MLKHYKAIHKGGQTFYEHRLIVEKMLGRKLSTDEIVHHIDGNKWNNDPSNLEVVTRSEHARMHFDEINRSKPVVQLDNDGNALKVWASAREAERGTGASFQNIYKCCRGIRNTAGGYKWRYANEANAR
ncbi:MAG: HNH endonuclease [Aeriscardovia sp.]|nr:HNH endonuclease [Aeriscardovia sp.]